MNETHLALVLTVALAAGLGTLLMLPRRHGGARPRAWHALGLSLAAVGAAAFGLLLTPPEGVLASLFFYGFALLAFLAAVLMVTNRNPVNSALLFAAVVLSSSGLFLLAGAQFLAAGTVIVYAGAIIVTFLFVIMLAQSEGNALYDRLARAPGRSTLVAFALLGGLLYAVVSVKDSESRTPEQLQAQSDFDPRLRDGAQLEASVRATPRPGPSRVYDMAMPASARLVPESPSLAEVGVPPPHVAGLGGTLFTDHLISFEVVGVLLFVALVGASAIATPRPPIRPGAATAGSPGPPRPGAA